MGLIRWSLLLLLLVQTHAVLYSRNVIVLGEDENLFVETLDSKWKPSDLDYNILGPLGPVSLEEIENLLTKDIEKCDAATWVLPPWKYQLETPYFKTKVSITGAVGKVKSAQLRLYPNGGCELKWKGEGYVLLPHPVYNDKLQRLEVILEPELSSGREYSSRCEGYFVPVEKTTIYPLLTRDMINLPRDANSVLVRAYVMRITSDELLHGVKVCWDDNYLYIVSKQSPPAAMGLYYLSLIEGVTNAIKLKAKEEKGKEISGVLQSVLNKTPVVLGFRPYYLYTERETLPGLRLCPRYASPHIVLHSDANCLTVYYTDFPRWYTSSSEISLTPVDSLQDPIFYSGTLKENNEVPQVLKDFLLLGLVPYDIKLDDNVIGKVLISYYETWGDMYSTMAEKCGVFLETTGSDMESILKASRKMILKEISEEVPPELDYRQVFDGKYLSRVQNQDGCGSCWVMAAKSHLETRVRMDTGMRVSIDPELVGELLGVDICKGGYPREVLKLASRRGIPVEVLYPSGKLRREKVLLRSVYPLSESATPDRIKKIIAYYAPIAGFLIQGNLVFADESGNVSFWPNYYLGSEGFHAVQLVGYSGDDILIKNSWGPNWEDNGYWKTKFMRLASYDMKISKKEGSYYLDINTLEGPLSYPCTPATDHVCKENICCFHDPESGNTICIEVKADPESDYGKKALEYFTKLKEGDLHAYICDKQSTWFIRDLIYVKDTWLEWGEAS